MAVVSHGVRALLGADGATFVLRDGDRCFYAEEDAISPLWKGRRFPINACISGWCMTHNQPAAIPDIHHDHRIPADAYRPTFVRSLVMAPVGRGEPVAALGAYWAEAREPLSEEVERLQAIADATALATARFQPLPPVHRVSEPVRPATSDRLGLQGFIDRVRRDGLRPNSLEACAFAVACVAIAALLRLAVQTTGVHGLQLYSTYYPAALLATLVGGRWAGALAAALGGVAANLLARLPLHTPAPPGVADALNLLLYGVSCALIILIIDGYKRAVLRLQQEDAKHLTLAREQHHRVRNAAAVAEAIVHGSLRDEPERARAINRRIRTGLAEIDIQERGVRPPVDLRELFTAELQPYDLSRFVLEGERGVALPCEARRALVLAIHELTTNALKHGALSVAEGRVTVTWCALGDTATISWREAGGPLVQPPTKRGFGSVLVRRLIEAAGGALALQFEPAGLIAEISLPHQPPRRG